MIDHAKRVLSIHETDKLMEEMERESAPLFYTLVCLATLVACMLITEYHDAKAEAKHLSELLAQCANGKDVAFDGKYLECKLTSMVAGL